MLEFIVMIRIRWYLVQHLAVKKGKRELRCCSKHKSGVLKRAPVRPAPLLLKKDLPLPGFLVSAGILSKFRFGVLVVI